jgi:hypothetical protein
MPGGRIDVSRRPPIVKVNTAVNISEKEWI